MKIEVGQKVGYTPRRGGDTDGKTYTVRSFGLLPGGGNVVWLEEKSGCVASWAVVPLPANGKATR